MKRKRRNSPNLDVANGRLDEAAPNQSKPLDSSLTPAHPLPLRRLLFLMFFLSGFCALLYQVVWTRLAFASFGVNTPVLSIVISVFMLGLALGSWFGGRIIIPLTARTRCSAAYFYALAELGIGLGAFAVPRLFALGERCLLPAGESDSTTYLLLSAAVITLSLLPWCVCMGATFPFMMAQIREREPAASTSSFSFLYLANVLGAMAGTLLTAVMLIELLGFHRTLTAGAVANLLAAALALWLGARTSPPHPVPAAAPIVPLPAPFAGENLRGLAALLFLTGFVSMAMEVVWIRAFTPVLKTQVYSFALVLFVYLLATALGSALYRQHLQRGKAWSIGTIVRYLAATALLPAAVNDPRWLGADLVNFMPLASLVLLASISPFCFLLGYLSPRLIDDYALGHPRGAGRAYALNVFGCILGPLFASYALLPRLGEKAALVILSLALLIFSARYFFRFLHRRDFPSVALVVGMLCVTLFVTKSFENYELTHLPGAQIRRDYVATTISGDVGIYKRLLVNGVGMTKLSTITKCMAHLPLAFHTGQPESALVICFGMGTSYRSALSWDVRTTAVELVPGVKDAFGFYYADAAVWAHHPKGRIVVDDGRRFLRRTAEKFDVILVDPPPPIEAAGSSLLYSEEFYVLARQHLKPHGILQAWFPVGSPDIQSAFARSLHNSFPYVRVFRSIAGWGFHCLASMEPVDNLSAEEMIARMPELAKKDLLEWHENENLKGGVSLVLDNPVELRGLFALQPGLRITDDRPFNEYYLMRRVGLAPFH